jgi:undecaprenyl-diphosphatase
MNDSGKSRRPAGLVPALLFGALFAALGAAVDAGATMRADDLIRASVHGLASPALTWAANAASFIGGTPVICGALAATVLRLWVTGERRPAIRLTAVMAAALAIDLATKYGFQRIRPEPFFGTEPDSFSFPSGHALFAVAFFVTLLLVVPGGFRTRRANVFAWSIVLFLVTAIGLSRIYLGVHYPSDVAGGYLAGGFAITAVSTVLDRTDFGQSS